MPTSWSAIVVRYAELRAERSDELEKESLQGIENLARYVAEGPLAAMLYGWTSAFDLCIQQTDAPPYSCSYLRVSPAAEGLVDFRYVDTGIRAVDWHRTEAPERVVARFDHFLDQLHWIAPPLESSPEGRRPNV